MSTDILTTPTAAHRAAARMRVGAWGGLTLFLAAFAIFEAQKYGVPTTAAAVLFFLLPDTARRFAAGHRRVVALAHNAWLPTAILVGYTVGPVVWPPLFTAGLGWLTRIAITRLAVARLAVARLAVARLATARTVRHG
ncbi:hypothetical protein [Streptodolium elevatio]|uniref:DUF4260 domain-containing protein n=1 Tax=Streptodolium elevatio TaxID=3157996 RepID=A0ABV3DGA5_9ACTN